jgi:hypothetical protein
VHNQYIIDLEHDILATPLFFLHRFSTFRQTPFFVKRRPQPPISETLKEPHFSPFKQMKSQNVSTVTKHFTPYSVPNTSRTTETSIKATVVGESRLDGGVSESVLEAVGEVQASQQTGNGHDGSWNLSGLKSLLQGLDVLLRALAGGACADKSRVDARLSGLGASGELVVDVIANAPGHGIWVGAGQLDGLRDGFQISGGTRPGGAVHRVVGRTTSYFESAM